MYFLKSDFMELIFGEGKGGSGETLVLRGRPSKLPSALSFCLATSVSPLVREVDLIVPLSETVTIVVW